MAEPTRNRQSCDSKPSRCFESKTVYDIREVCKAFRGFLTARFQIYKMQQKGDRIDLVNFNTLQKIEIDYETTQNV